MRVDSWVVDADDPLCTLKDAFLRVDSHLGFNIELKFDDDVLYQESELVAALEIIHRVALEHAGDRPVMFSTFHPDAARLMRRIQSIFPVFFLIDAGTEMYADSRRNSLEEAIKLCSESGLQGIVSEVRGVLRDPAAIAGIKEAGLALLTYGELNNVPEAVYMQHLMGIDGVIVDLVREITEVVSDLIGREGRVDEEARPRFSQRELTFSPEFDRQSCRRRRRRRERNRFVLLVVVIALVCCVHEEAESRVIPISSTGARDAELRLQGHGRALLGNRPPRLPPPPTGAYPPGQHGNRLPPSPTGAYPHGQHGK